LVTEVMVTPRLMESWAIEVPWSVDMTVWEKSRDGTSMVA
jgi:hypothetical protein